MHLAVLEEFYQEKKDSAIRSRVQADILAFHKKLCSKTKAQHLEVLLWLKHFAHVFELSETIQNLFVIKGYGMASLSDSGWRQKRTIQLRGLEKLIHHNFAGNYSIILKEHQMQSYKSEVVLKSGLHGGYFCLPTGAGKSSVALLIMSLLASQMPTLFIVPTTTLMDQVIETIKKLSPKTHVARFDGSAKHCFGGEFMVTTYASLEKDSTRREPLIPLEAFGIVWADEAHHSITAGRAHMIRQLQQTAHVFGLTATDYYETTRKKGDLGAVSEIFGSKIFEIPLEDLIVAGELSPIKNVIVHAKDLPVKNGGWRNKTQDAFYTDAELESILNQDAFNDVICDIYLNEHDPYTAKPLFEQSTLIFCAGINHAESVCSL